MPADSIDKPNRIAIPKFTSFKRPTADANPSPEHGNKNVDKERAFTKGERNTKKRLFESCNLSQTGYTVEQYNHKHQHRSKPSSTSPTRPNRVAGKQKHHITKLQSGSDNGQHYFTDSRGDRANLSYGRPDRYMVPNYSRIGYGRIVGLGTSDKINHNLSNDEAIVTYSPTVHNYGYPRGLLTVAYGDEELRITSASDGTEAWISNSDFVSLQPNDAKTSSAALDVLEDNKDVDYRFMARHRKPNSEPEENQGLRPEALKIRVEQNCVNDNTNQIRERHAQLSRTVKAEPSNLNAWLHLAEHQEDLAKLGHTSKKAKLTIGEQRLLAEIRLSIFEDALREIGDNQTKKICLLEKIMIEGSKIWDTKAILSRWQRYLKLHPSAIGLWKLYLDFMQSNLSIFRLEHCKSAFLECLRTLAAVGSSKELECFRLYIVLRFSVLARDSGYTELATAIWQALLEFQIFRPTENSISGWDSTNTSSIMGLFQEFWESEVPRIGEVGASGWKAYIEGKGDFPDPVNFTKSKILDQNECFSSFAEVESLLSKDNVLPARSLDDMEDDDPFRVVLFSDIQDFIIYSPAQIPGIVWVQAFLCFCTLPPLQHNENTQNLDLWWQDTFLRTSPVRQRNDKAVSLNTSIRSTLSTLLSRSFTLDDIVVPIKWVASVLASLSNAIAKDDIVSQYYLAFTYNYCTENFEKVAKDLLKHRRTSVKLLLAYGLVKYRQSGKIAGEKVFKSILHVSHMLPISEKENLPFLWQAWAWEALKLRNFDTAMRCVLQSCSSEPMADIDSKEPATQPCIAAGEQAILDAISTSILEKRTDHVIAYTECLAILKYMQSHEDVALALQCFQDTSNLLGVQCLTKSAVNEIIHQSRADFLQWHMSTKKLFRPATARSILAESIYLFPNNTKFLALYFKNEARFRIDDRVRAIIRDSVLGSHTETIIGWQFAVWTEQNRGVEMGATVHSVRASFEKAVDSESCRHSPLIWQSYVLFEYERGELHRAKSIFWRGLTRLPWVKAYMMLAFTHLRSVMDHEELRNVYNVMAEKELRLRVDVSKVLCEQDEAKRRDEISLEQVEGFC